MQDPGRTKYPYGKDRPDPMRTVCIAGLLLTTGIFLAGIYAASNPMRRTELAMHEPGRRQPSSVKLPRFAFHTTAYKFPDEAMRSYQNDLNKQGVRMARAYAGIRSALSEADTDPAAPGKPHWRHAFEQNLAEFRKAGNSSAIYRWSLPRPLPKTMHSHPSQIFGRHRRTPRTLRPEGRPRLA